MKSISLKAASLLLYLVSVTLHAAVEPLAGTPAQEKATQEIVKTLNQRHVVSLPIDDKLSSRFLDSYLKRLDPNKVYFLQSDIEEFEQHRNSLDDDLLSGSNTVGFKIYERWRTRLETHLKKAVSTLRQSKLPYSFEKNEELIIDEDKLDWPANQKEADDMWRKRIKSQILSEKLAGDSIKEAQETLVKRYEGQLDRISKTTTEDIYENYINAYTELYDPHTNYFSPRTSENFNINMSLSLEGIGAVLQTEDDYTKVVRLVTAGPADKSGQLQAADKIIGVAQGDKKIVDVVGWRLDEVVDLIRGPKDSIVRLEIIPSSSTSNTSKVISIKRDKVKLEDQAAQKAIIDIKDGNKTVKVGIIDIPTFYMDFEAFRKRDPNYRSTKNDVARLIQELEAEDVDGIVIDLRNNGGGSLFEATAVTDLFIDQGQPVVQIGRDNGRKLSDYSRNHPVYKGPLVVLINRLSASASEIFAGAIQDYNRGLIVGSQSFGKGTVQTLTPLTSQGELKITESKFYRVSGDSTQHRGVIPDILMPELINSEEVGESSYDTALPWTKTFPVRHGLYHSLEEIIPSLSIKHQKRIDSDPDFIYLNKRKALLDEVNQQTSISLNEKRRISEQKELEAQTLQIENERRKAKGLALFKNYDELQKDNEKRNTERAAAAGTTVIDTEDDAILRETSYILLDYKNLLIQKHNDNKIAKAP